MSGKRFRYALQPVLLMRQWDLDTLRRELSERNAALEVSRAECEAMRAQATAASQQWNALGADPQPLSVDRFMLLSRYIGDRGAQLRALEQTLARLEDQRDEIIVKVTGAQRALEAVEQHRGRAHDSYVRARLSDDFKVADDQWGVLQRGRASHDD